MAIATSKMKLLTKKTNAGFHFFVSHTELHMWPIRVYLTYFSPFLMFVVLLKPSFFLSCCQFFFFIMSSFSFSHFFFCFIVCACFMCLTMVEFFFYSCLCVDAKQQQ